MTTDRVPDLDELERHLWKMYPIGIADQFAALIQRLREAEKQRDGFASDSAFFGQQYSNALARIERLERVRKAADDIPLCQDCMMDRADDLLAALAAVDDDR